MVEEPDDIDLDQIVWDPRYRRRVIERLNRIAHEPLPPLNEAPHPASDEGSRRR
jgi:hypothetical protein